jgi:hypothetical protein
MRTLGIKPSLEPERARQIALADYIPTRVTTAKPESVFANVFPLALPNSMLVYDLRSVLTGRAALELRNQWAFVELGPNRLIAFTPPPSNALKAAQGKQALEFSWRDYDEKRLGKKPMDIAKELAWRTLDVACANKGLKFCPDRKVHDSAKSAAATFPSREGIRETSLACTAQGRTKSSFAAAIVQRSWKTLSARLVEEITGR